jgi:peptidoglycan/LPS O-acetylase OafA/YrhL
MPSWAILVVFAIVAAFVALMLRGLLNRNEWAWTLTLLGGAAALRWFVGDVIGSGTATDLSLLDLIGAVLLVGGLVLLADRHRRFSSPAPPPPPRPDDRDR